MRKAGAFVIEDDWANRLNFDEPPPSLLLREDQAGHVVYVRGLSKSMGAGMRVAAVIARGPAAQRIRAARVIEDISVSGLLQEAALDVLTSTGWTRHLRRLHSALRARRDALVTAVRGCFGPDAVSSVPRGGFHLWVRVRGDDVALARRAAAAGIVASPGSPCFPGEPPGSFLRLSFVAAEPATLRDGVERLADLARSLAGGDQIA